MKDWEEILKDRLEGYESSLPEDGLARFREKAAGPSRRRRISPWWVAVPAAAACAAIALMLRSPGNSGEITTISGNAEPVAEVVEAMQVREETVSDKTVSLPGKALAQAAKAPETAAAAPEPAAGPDPELSATDVTPASAPDEKAVGERIAPEGNATRSVQPSADPHTTVSEGSPIAPKAGRRHVGTRIVLPAVGGTLGTAAAGLGSLMLVAGPMATDFADRDVYKPSEVVDRQTGTDDHNMPLRLGLTARIPLGDRLSVVPGLEYSRYTSYFHYTVSGTHTQKADYLGIPVRIDYSPVKTGRLDVYAGAGTSLDFCIGARNNGARWSDDSPSLSLLTATGAEVRIAGPVALYLEPELKWTALHGNLDTWRTVHPVSFSVSTGIRISL